MFLIRSDGHNNILQAGEALGIKLGTNDGVQMALGSDGGSSETVCLSWKWPFPAALKAVISLLLSSKATDKKTCCKPHLEKILAFCRISKSFTIRGSGSASFREMELIFGKSRHNLYTFSCQTMTQGLEQRLDDGSIIPFSRKVSTCYRVDVRIFGVRWYCL